MKYLKYILPLFLLSGVHGFAQERKDTTMTDLRSRVVVNVEKDIIKHKLSVHFSEEARFMDNISNFDRSYTSLSLVYSPWQWLKIAPEYSLVSNLDTDASGHKEWEFRHRIALNLTGVVNFGQWEFSLRERPQVTVRTDSINVCEKMKAAFVLRSRAQAKYSFFSIPLKVYAFVEMTNTLNTPDTFVGPTGKGSGEVTFKLDNHIAKMRYSVGAQYRFDKRNSVELYYRLDDGQDYDIHITKKNGYLESVTTENYMHHILGVVYKFKF